MVVDELVDMAWVGTYGADKVAVVKKYVEPVAVGEREGQEWQERKYILAIFASQSKSKDDLAKITVRSGRVSE